MALEKTITISGKEVTFKVNGSIPLRYRMQFQRDYFADFLSIAKIMNNSKDLTQIQTDRLDTTVFYNILYIMAKIADNEINDMMEWLSEFDDFPIFEVVSELQDLLMANTVALVDKVKKK